MLRRTFTTLALALVVVALPATAARPEPESLASALKDARQLLVDVRHGVLDRESIPSGKPSLLPMSAATAPLRNLGTLVGTWFVVVPGETPFYAYQTFGVDGTFVETSSLLATLTEGPAHGAWRQAGNTNYLTFELFAFEAGEAIGRIRVRCSVTVDGNVLEAQSAVDILALDGELIAADVASGPFTGTRLRALQP
jgi:hypothetical protein